MAEEKLKTAISAARVHHSGAPDITYHEPHMTESIKSFLSSRGHQIAETSVLGLVNVIHCPGGLPREPKSCEIEADPRGSGLAYSAGQ